MSEENGDSPSPAIPCAALYVPKHPPSYGDSKTSSEDDSKMQPDEGKVVDLPPSRMCKSVLEKEDDSKMEPAKLAVLDPPVPRMRQSMLPSNITPTPPPSQPLLTSWHTKPLDTTTQSDVIWQLRNFPTLFGTIADDHVTFCIDTSGSMYNCLDAVKQHLIELLFQKAHDGKAGSFNLIEFGTEVTQWSDKMVQWTPQTVAVAAEWISNLEVKTGSNMLDALITAFYDENCEAVVLVTDGNPDQHPADILDTIAYAAQNRPVHCFYVQDNADDQVSLEFLQDLAMETFGSIHIVTVTQHGSIERVTPLYRAELAAERVIRTSHGQVYPSNYKKCTVSTTLNNPPKVITDPMIPYYPYPYWYNNYAHMWPYRHRFMYPHIGWSRFRHIKGWEKYVQDMEDLAAVPPVTAGPGAFLVDTKVLARRNEDGFYYIGKVKSQLLNNKFLIEFNPTKHGKYIKTSYQETFVYDLISLTDGLRHAIVAGDKVLAPWEPEGQRYAPGVVMEGQEKRSSLGGGADSAVMVSFCNGKSATVPNNTAVWIPPQLHERITFELQLPTKVRKEFTEEREYPAKHLDGYPTGGEPKAPAFPHFEPQMVCHPDPFVPYPGDFSPYYVPLYPIYYKNHMRPSVVKREEVCERIPGTELTKNELSDRVNQQLSDYQQHRSNYGKLLQKKETSEASTKLEKSVTFENSCVNSHVQESKKVKTADENECSDIEAEYYSGDLQFRDSGHGTDNEEDVAQDEDERKVRDVGVGTNVNLYYRRRKVRPASADSRPMWKYWNNEPAPELMEPLHYGPYRVGPYDEVVAAAPLELRHNRVSSDGLEWANGFSENVDLRKSTVADCMNHHYPRPPSAKPPKQGSGVELSTKLGEGQRQQELFKQQDERNAYRRAQVQARQQYWQDQREEKFQQKQAMKEQHRQQCLNQRSFEMMRRQAEVDKLQNQRDTKARLNEQIRLRWEAERGKQLSQKHDRLEVLRVRRAEREQQAWARSRELETNKARAQAMKRDLVQQRHDAHTQRVLAEDAKFSLEDASRARANLKRVQHFHQMEDNAQRMRQLRSQVRNQTEALFRSSVNTEAVYQQVKH